MKARNDGTNAPIGDLMKPMYVLRMNWWHWSDENRLKWLVNLAESLFLTMDKVHAEIMRLEASLCDCAQGARTKVHERECAATKAVDG